jgi:plastocyanin
VCFACGKHDTFTDAPKPQPEAGAATVVEVSCTGITPAATVTTSDGSFMFSPESTIITQGQVVQFSNSSIHDVVPDNGSDPGLRVDFGATKCLRFTQTGRFGFHCRPHGFMGSVTVQ